jgi:regulator of cell morphogenesis and NO signaling
MLSLAEIATHIPASIKVFEKHRIDFYRKGKRTLEETCSEHLLVPAVIEEEISRERSCTGNDNMNIHEWNIERVIDHIQFRYHSTERSSLVFIGKQIKDIHDMYPDPVIEKLGTLFSALVADLTEHAEEEERELFPYIKKMAEVKRGKVKTKEIKIILHNPIGMLEAEHELTGQLLDDIRELTNNYAHISGAERYNELMNDLVVFQEDFHVHIHLENNVLFPKALELESELKGMVK